MSSTETTSEQKNNNSPSVAKTGRLLLFVRFVVLVLILLVLLIAYAVYFVGTDEGTEYIINKINKETGYKLNYGKGNFRDGLWIKNVDLPINKTFNIKTDKAYVKLGWRAIFDKQIHLRDVQIDNLILNDTAPSSNKPFAYPRIELPVQLRLNQANINRITYNITDINPLIFKDIQAKNLAWIGTKLDVGKADLTFAYVDEDNKKDRDIVRVKNTHGYIDFDKNYPIHAKTTVDVFDINQHYFDDVELIATGSLQKLHGELKSHYNNFALRGKIDIEPMKNDTPFTAQVTSSKFVKLPYVTDFDIQLKRPIINGSGTWKKIKLTVKTDLSAKNIPTGKYTATANINTLTGQMDIDKLTAKTKKGEIIATGEMNWDKEYWLKAQAKSSNYQLDKVIPTEWKEYQGYLPKKLNGTLDFYYQHHNKNGQMQIDSTLRQKNAETVNAQIIELKDYNNSKKSNSYQITADWQNLYRKIDKALDVHNIGIIDSQHGKAKLLIKDDYLTADIDGQIRQVSLAPEGNYQVNLALKNNVVDLKKINYQGKIGDLTGVGKVVIPKKNEPIAWQLTGKTNYLYPSIYNKNIPIAKVQGGFSINSLVHLIKSKNNLKQQHKLQINQANLSAILADDNKRKIAMNGQGVLNLTVNNDDLTDYDFVYNGKLTTENAPQGKYQVIAKGTPTQIAFEKINYQGKDSKLQGKGKFSWKDILTWQFKGKFNNFDVSKFHADTQAIITGNLDTTGKLKLTDKAFQLTDLQKISLNFDGDLKTNKVPQGKYQVIAKGTAKNLDFDKLNYQGKDSKLQGKGKFSWKDVLTWQFNGKFNNFDVSKFHSDTQAIITGNLDTTGKLKLTDKAFQPLQDLQGLAVKFDGELRTEKLPKGRLAIDAQLDEKNQTIRIAHFQHHSKDSAIRANGQIQLPTKKQDVQWQLQGEMNNFNLAYFNKNIDSQLTGKLSTTGKWNKHQQQIEISDMDIYGHLLNMPLQATGGVIARLHLPNDMKSFLSQLKTQNNKEKQRQVQKIIEQLEVNDLLARWGDNQLSAHGDMQTFQAKVDIDDFKKLHKDLRGKIVGYIRLVDDDGLNQQVLPTLDINLMAKQLSMPDVTLNDGWIKGQIVNLGKHPSQIVMQVKELMIKKNSFNNLNVKVVGTQNDHEINFAVKNEQLKLSSQLIGQLKANKQWQGVLSQGRIRANSTRISLEQKEPSQLFIDFNQPKVTLTAHCWYAKRITGKFCLNDTLVFSQNEGRLDFSLKSLDTSLFKFILPNELQWQAKLNGFSKIYWKKGTHPKIKGTFYSDNGIIGLIQEDDTHVSIPYERISLIGLNTSKGLRLRTDVHSGSKGKGFAELTIDPYQKDKPISGKLALEHVNFALLKPFFTGMRTFGGYGSLETEINGTLKKPLINGKLKIQDGFLSMIGLPVRLDKINSQVDINDTHAKVVGSFYSGEGKGELTGSVDWRNALQMKLAIKGNQLEISEPPLLSAKLDPDINLIVQPKKKEVSITGAISIPFANIRPPKSNASIIGKSSDVTVLDRREIENIDKVFAVTKPWAINTNIGIDLGKEVEFKGFGAELPLVGAIVVNQKGQGKLKAKGVVQVSHRSNIEAFGQNIELDYAQIRFNGNIRKPNLSISASKKIEGNKIGFKVKGDVNSPKISVFSDTGLSEQQVMNALVTGRLENVSANKVSEKGFRSEITNNLIATGLGFGLDNTRAITNSIGRAVGLKSLTLSASGNSDDTNIHVTGYITPDLYIRYAFGVFNAQTQLSARYQLTQQLYLQATSATEKFIDLVYGWKF